MGSRAAYQMLTGRGGMLTSNRADLMQIARSAYEKFDKDVNIADIGLEALEHR